MSDVVPPAPVAALVDAVVSMLGAMAAADEAKVRLLASAVSATRALAPSPPVLFALLIDVRTFLADELAVNVASHEQPDGSISAEGQAMVATVAALVARIDAVLSA